MRIVAGDAADARVRSIEAAAVGKPVRLEADVGFAMPAAAHHHLPAAVALAAEGGEILSAEAAEIGWVDAEIATVHGGLVLERSGVAASAGHAGMQGGERETAVDGGSGGVTAETGARVDGVELAAEGLLDRGGDDGIVAGGGVEAVDGGVVADQAFVELAVAIEYPGLVACAEAPHDGSGESGLTVGDGIGAVATARLDGPGEVALLHGEAGVRVKDGIVAGERESTAHHSARLGAHLSFMAASAGERRRLGGECVRLVGG